MANRRQFDALLPQLKSGTLHPGILADWLEENDAGLDLWCLSWRDVPEPADEFQRRWAEWLRQVEPGRLLQESAPSGWRSVDRRRWEAVRDAKEDVQQYADLVVNDPALLRELIAASPMLVDLVTTERNEGIVPRLPIDHPIVQAAEVKARATVRRERKRRILGLFPEVEIIHRQIRVYLTDAHYHRDPEGLIDQWTEEAKAKLFDEYPHVPLKIRDGARERCFIFEQTICASDLIPPEGSRVDPVSLPGNFDFSAKRWRMEDELIRSMGVPQRFFHPEGGY